REIVCHKGSRHVLAHKGHLSSRKLGLLKEKEVPAFRSCNDGTDNPDNVPRNDDSGEWHRIKRILLLFQQVAMKTPANGVVFA
ncbi:hypothetical protein, partial [Stenotrophomonas sp.]|uniref:hypothetical protein n=1 Tax=Stenotrophomonas sp. TaxID=69392 RepID=UPI0028AF8E57